MEKRTLGEGKPATAFLSPSAQALRLVPRPEPFHPRTPCDCRSPGCSSDSADALLGLRCPERSICRGPQEAEPGPSLGIHALPPAKEASLWAAGGGGNGQRALRLEAEAQVRRWVPPPLPLMRVMHVFIH